MRREEVNLFRTDPRSDLHRAASRIARKVSTDKGVKKCQETQGEARRVRERAMYKRERAAYGEDGRGNGGGKVGKKERKRARERGGEGGREGVYAAKRATGVREPTETLCDD